MEKISKKKFLIDKKGIIHTVYSDTFHLLLGKVGKVQISKRMGDVYSMGANWFVRMEHYKDSHSGDLILKIFGPFPTKGEAVRKEEKYLEQENFLIGREYR